MDYYWKSRENKDFCGNNQLHIVFEIDDLALRHQFLTLLIEEGVGNPNKRNVQGLLPQ